MTIKPEDMKELKKAKELLENPGIAARLTDIIGTPIEKGLELLPDNWNDKIKEVTQLALTKAMDSAAFTMKNISGLESSDRFHKLIAAASGAVGGAFGLPALTIELPISTIIMLRSILDIARAEGEDITSIDSKLASLEVFALGGTTKIDDASESGYFAIRAVLARSVTEAAEFIASRGMVEEGAPVVVRLIAKIAARFSVQVSEKAAVQAIPIVGAIGGAVINSLFIDHFQDMARGHFTVRRLENIYGKETVRTAYDSI